MYKKTLRVVECLLAITLFWGGIYVIGQQVRRADANHPQMEMVDRAIEKLANGAEITNVVPKDTVNIDTDVGLFMIILNENGEVATGTPRLGGETPTPPKGVLNYAKKNGINKVTWQLEKGVRAAIVVKPYPHGWVLAGRSLKNVEADEGRWLCLSGLLWGGSGAVGWAALKRLKLI